MLGVRFGLADGAIEGFLWTEICLSLGLAHFAALSGGVAPRASGLDINIRLKRSVSDHPVIVDAGGVDLLLIAGRIADFIGAEGAGAYRVINTSGGVFAPYITYRIARLGLDASARWHRSSGAEPQSARAKAAERPVVYWSGDEIASFDSREQATITAGQLDIVTRRAPSASQAADEAALAGPIDYALRASSAVRDGLHVEEAQFRAFERFAMMRWVDMRLHARTLTSTPSSIDNAAIGRGVP